MARRPLSSWLRFGLVGVLLILLICDMAIGTRDYIARGDYRYFFAHPWHLAGIIVGATVVGLVCWWADWQRERIKDWNKSRRERLKLWAWMLANLLGTLGCVWMAASVVRVCGVLWECPEPVPELPPGTVWPLLVMALVLLLLPVALCVSWWRLVRALRRTSLRRTARSVIAAPFVLTALALAGAWLYSVWGPFDSGLRDYVVNGRAWKVRRHFRRHPEDLRASGRAMLDLALEEGHANVVASLLDAGVPPIGSRVAHQSPLHVAALNGHAGVVRLLLGRGWDVKGRDDYGDTPLHEAAAGGDVATLRLLVTAGADVNARDGYGRTPLHEAALRGNAGALRALIEAGADIAATDRTGRTLLHAAADGDEARTIQLLVQEGVDVDATDMEGRTPLHEAAEWGNAAAIRALIGASADVTAADNAGRTPLDYAAPWTLDEEVADALLTAGAEQDVWTASALGDTAALDRILSDNPAAVNRSRDAFDPPLLWAIRSERNDTVDYLLSRGADANRGGEDGTTPLTVAAEWGSPATVQALLEHGADPNLGGRHGAMPLIVAAESADPAVVRMLLEHGADPSARDDQGRTALDIARESGRTKVARLLEGAMAGRGGSARAAGRVSHEGDQ